MTPTSSLSAVYAWVESCQTRPREEDEQLARIALVAGEGVDLLILHECPNGDGNRQDGHPGIRAIIDGHAAPLTICGHFHWESPLSCHPGGQILNVDSRVIVLMR